MLGGVGVGFFVEECCDPWLLCLKCSIFGPRLFHAKEPSAFCGRAAPKEPLKGLIAIMTVSRVQRGRIVVEFTDF